MLIHNKDDIRFAGMGRRFAEGGINKIPIIEG